MEDLKIILARHNRAKIDTLMPENMIYYYDLTVLISGELEYIINRKQIILKPGDAIFIPPSSLRGRTEAKSPCDYISLNFTCSSNIELPLYMPGAVTNELKMQIALCDELCKKFYPDIESTVSPLAVCMINTLKNNLESENLPETVRKIADYIHRNLANKITLNDIGEYTFFSPIYCDTLFKGAMGRSIIDYTIELRIEEAKKLILHDTAPLVQIAAAVGFADYNYFARTFKKRCGYTPHEYKRIFLGKQ